TDEPVRLTVAFRRRRSIPECGLAVPYRFARDHRLLRGASPEVLGRCNRDASKVVGMRCRARYRVLEGAQFTRGSLAMVHRAAAPADLDRAGRDDARVRAERSLQEVPREPDAIWCLATRMAASRLTGRTNGGHDGARTGEASEAVRSAQAKGHVEVAGR